MLYVIYAADQIYQGLHGMHDYSIYDCDTVSEAEDIGIENSIQVINSYSIIYEQLEDDIQDYIDGIDDPVRGLTEKEIEEIREDFYNEDIFVEIYKVDTDIAKEFDIDTLERLLYDDPEYFIENYCEE